MTYLVSAKTMGEIIKMQTDGIISKTIATKLLHYYEAKKKIELGEVTMKNFQILADMHMIKLK